jgi:hypothetical protein
MGVDVPHIKKDIVIEHVRFLMGEGNGFFDYSCTGG